MKGKKKIIRENLRKKVFMDIAFSFSELSLCCRRNVGAILVKDNHIISTGYNGTPKGVLNCTEGGCTRCNDKEISSGNLNDCICVHAELNCILQAAKFGISTQDCVMYCTTKPCQDCIKNCINAGIKEIYYYLDYPTETNRELLKKIRIIKLNTSIL